MSGFFDPDYNGKRAHERLHDAVGEYLRTTAHEGNRLESFVFDTPYGKCQLIPDKIPEPPLKGEAEVDVLFNPAINHIFAHEAGELDGQPSHYIHLARVTVPWEWKEGL